MDFNVARKWDNYFNEHNAILSSGLTCGRKRGLMRTWVAHHNSLGANLRARHALVSGVCVRACVRTCVRSGTVLGTINVCTEVHIQHEYTHMHVWTSAAYLCPRQLHDQKSIHAFLLPVLARSATLRGRLGTASGTVSAARVLPCELQTYHGS